jgi:hypothetical protein
VSSTFARSARSPGPGSVSGARTGPTGRPAQPGGRLDQRDGVAGHSIAQFHQGHVELPQQPVDGVVVACGQCGEEGVRDFRREGVHGRGISRDADGGVGASLDFGGGRAVEEQEAFRRGEGEALEPVEVAAPVLEADHGRDFRDPAQAGGGEGDLVALVGDQWQVGAVGDPAQLLHQPVLRRGDQVVGQHQQGIRPGLLSDPGEPPRLGPAVADARDHRHPAVGHFDRARDDGAVLVLVQRAELARPAGREHGPRPGGELRGQVRPVRVRVEVAVVPETGERKGKDPAGHAVAQPLGHGFGVRVHEHILVCKRRLRMQMEGRRVNAWGQWPLRARSTMRGCRRVRKARPGECAA